MYYYKHILGMYPYMFVERLCVIHYTNISYCFDCYNFEISAYRNKRTTA